MFNPNYKTTDAFSAKWHTNIGPIPVIYLILPLLSVLFGFFSHRKLYFINLMIIGIGIILFYGLSFAYSPFYNMFKHRKTKCTCSK